MIDGGVSTSIPQQSVDGKKKLTEEFDEQLVKDCEERIKKLVLQFRAASDNGMFSSRQKRTFEKKGIDPNALSTKIIDSITEARRKLYEGDAISSERSLLLAERAFYDVVYGTTRLWRFSYVYAGSLWAYFLGMLLSISAFYFLYLDVNFLNINNVEIFPLLGIQAVVWGAIGGLFQDVWYLWKHVQNRYYRRTWIIQYLSAPFIGGILGAIVYIIIIAGLFALDSDASGTPQAYVVMGLAAFAGYNWDWAIRRFETIGARFQD